MIGDRVSLTRHVLETIKGVIEAAGGSTADVTYNMIFLKRLGALRNRQMQSMPSSFRATNRRGSAFGADW